MNKLITILISLSLLISISNLSFAKQAMRKPITIPAEMYKIKSPFGFEVYLGNPDKRKQQAAVKRLGQIGGSNAIGVLMKFYENEPIQIHGRTSICSVQHSTREDVVDALRQIGSKEAKKQIIKILRDTLRFGETGELFSGSEHISYRGQSSGIIYKSIDALSIFPDDDVIGLLEKMAADQNPPSRSTIAISAKESLIKIELKKQGFGGGQLEDKVNYLVNKLTGKPYGGSSISSGIIKTEAVNNRAISNIINNYGFDALPYLEEILKDIPENSVKAEAIKEIIVNSKRSSANIEKAKEKAKNKPMEMLNSSLNGRREKAEKNSK